MGTENYANGKITYTSVEDVNRSCVENLKDDAHYRFQCRCGCGATFAGYGRDIRAAARVGGDITAFPSDPQIGDQWYDQRTNTIYVCSDRNDDRPVWNKVEPTVITTNGAGELAATAAYYDLKNKVDEVLEEEEAEEESVMLDPIPSPAVVEAVPPVYVSDRYLKKAQFDLSDEEIDAYAKESEDPLVPWMNLSKRQPPAIGDLVYSLVTGKGPMSLLEYQDKEIKVEGETKRILCGLCRTQDGKYVKEPLADLDVEFPNRARPKRWATWKVGLAMILSGIVGSAISLGAWHYFPF
jgi:hypothetical protein